jgi:Fe-S-cluster containining protein
VPVDGQDVWTFMTRLHLQPEQFLIVCRQMAPSPGGFRLQRGGATYALALDKQGHFAADQPCVFLAYSPDGTSRCSVYADRPAVCRTYPMTLLEGRIAPRAASLCPPGAWSDDEPQRPAWSAALRRLRIQHETYAEVATRWNAMVDEAPPAVRILPPAYLKYLLTVYDRLGAVQPEPADTGLSELEYQRKAKAVIWQIYPEVDAKWMTLGNSG